MWCEYLKQFMKEKNRFAKESRGSRRGCNYSIKSYMIFSNVANLQVKLNDNVRIIR